MRHLMLITCISRGPICHARPRTMLTCSSQPFSTISFDFRMPTIPHPCHQNSNHRYQPIPMIPGVHSTAHNPLSKCCSSSVSSDLLLCLSLFWTCCRTKILEFFLPVLSPYR